MAWDISISKYCDQTTFANGMNFYKVRGISHETREQMADGTWRVNGKAIDSFNFVNHPWLAINNMGQELLGFGCDCPDSKRKRTMCEHCVALGLTVGHGHDYTYPVEIPVPAEPKTETDPIPVPPPEDPPVIWEPYEETTSSEEDTEPALPEQPAEEAIRSMEILFGHNMNDDTPVYWFPNDTEQVFHTNVGIIGTMGTGKTQFTKSMVTQIYRARNNNFDGHPLGILIFDYKGDYNETKADFVKATNARVLKPYRLPYNPLALNPSKAFKPLLPMHTANEFKDTISQIYNLGPKQQQVLLDCIVKAYAKQGIDPANPSTWGRLAPTVDQVYQIFVDETFGRPVDSLTAAINKLHQFCLFEPDPRRAMSLERILNGVVVVDLSGYDSDIQSLIVAITLNQFYAQMQTQGSSRTDGRYRQLRSFILVDEADSFMSQGFPSLRKIMKEGREFGVGVILSTQSLSHFVGGDDDYSRYVLTWIVHNVSDLKQKDVEYVFKLQPKSTQIMRQYGTIKGLSKHESVLKFTNDLPITIRDKAFWQLYQELGI